MKQLKIQVGSKERILFDRPTIQFIRNINATKYLDIGYSNGTGVPAQVLTAGQVLYTEGTVGQVGYIRIQSTNNVTLNGTNTFNVTIGHFPSTTQSNQTKSFIIDGSSCTIDITYNSAPETNDITVSTPNRTNYIFALIDILPNIVDYDGDAVDSIELVGNTVGLQYNGVPYISNTWIPMSDIAQGKLVYVPADQDAAYDFVIDYRARDTNGNISQE